MNTTKDKKSFTLIELLIVIVIIGILAAALTFRIQKAQDRAKATRAQSDLKAMSTVFHLAELNTNQLLKDITGNGCTEYSCRSVSAGGTPIMSLADTHSCKTTREDSISLIGIAAGNEPVEQRFRDPRGSPYLLDENELELSPTDCRFDSLQSAGPDGRRTYENLIFPDQSAALSLPLNKDNVITQLRPVRCRGGY